MRLLGVSEVNIQSNHNPIYSYMKGLVENYNENPAATQLGRRITYSKKRYEKHKQRQERRPWLIEGDEQLDTVSRVRKLK